MGGIYSKETKGIGVLQVFWLKNCMGQHFLKSVRQTRFSVVETLKTESSGL